ncbi:MLO-like protein 6 [Typha angustifolia]|uniref:MLO-like protein 6 n=1 Tax=Typha angustifolia TaxID=59011 RepID=UPI003C2F123A
MDLEASLEYTPTWAVVGICLVLILPALLIEHGLHKLTELLERRKRKALNQALYHIETELRNLGFMSLLLTIAQKPISKICMPTSLADSFLPCRDAAPLGTFTEEPTCENKGKISLISSQGTDQLQLLIIVIAIFHVLSCLLTLALGEVKIKRWKPWEEETKSMEFMLSHDLRRFKLIKQTSFGRRHLKYWSKHTLPLWLVCFFRQFADSVHKADYFALRHGFLAFHFPQDCKFDFHKFLRRSIDHDFKTLVTISSWIWIYALFFIFFNGHGFYNHYWLPFIPLVILLVVGTKLEIIITKMCLDGANHAIIVPGTVRVKPNDEFFWFRRPRLLLHLIQFILIQNTFQLSFFAWTWYTFGFRSCYNNDLDDIILTIVFSILVQFLCAYVTLPLYALVSQMGSSTKETIFSDRVVDSLKNWRRRAKKKAAKKKKKLHSPTPSLSPLIPSSSLTVTEASPSSSPGQVSTTMDLSSSSPGQVSTTTDLSSSSPGQVSTTIDLSSSSSTATTSRTNEASTPRGRHGWRAVNFKYPSGRLELSEVQRVVEEIIQHGGNRRHNDGEVSFALWRRQSSDFSGRSRRSSLS